MFRWRLFVKWHFIFKENKNDYFSSADSITDGVYRFVHVCGFRRRYCQLVDGGRRIVYALGVGGADCECALYVDGTCIGCDSACR